MTKTLEKKGGKKIVSSFFHKSSLKGAIDCFQRINEQTSNRRRETKRKHNS